MSVDFQNTKSLILGQPIKPPAICMHPILDHLLETLQLLLEQSLRMQSAELATTAFAEMLLTIFLMVVLVMTRCSVEMAMTGMSWTQPVMSSLNPVVKEMI